MAKRKKKPTPRSEMGLLRNGLPPNDNTGKIYKKNTDPKKDKRLENKHMMKFNKVDIKKLKELCSIGCTMAEAESVLKVDDLTITKALKHFEGKTWKQFFKEHSTGFKMSLRRLQMRSAEGDFDIDNNKYNVLPSVPMQIWLGKQFLGQKDKNETVIEEKTNIPQFEWADAEDVTNQKKLPDAIEDIVEEIEEKSEEDEDTEESSV